MKYLLLFVVVIVGLMLHKKQRAARHAVASQAAQARRLRAPEPMHACTRCGVHVPASRCVWDAQQHPYCCAEHARQG